MTQRVFIYWNLHRDLYSMRGTKGLIVGYSRALRITGATFPVSEVGRQRVIASGHKNVHAGVRGEGLSRARRPPMSRFRGWRRVTYNPHKHSTFVTASDERAVKGADEVWMVIVDGRPRVYARGIQYADAEQQAA